MVPLNQHEHFGHVAAKAKLLVVLTIGLRTGCLNTRCSRTTYASSSV